jgi:hypothetical protein
VEILENVQKDVFDFLVGLAVHDVVPIRVLDLFLTYLSVRFGYAFLQLQKILIELFPHGIIAH